MARVRKVEKSRKAQKCGRCGCELPAGSAYFWWAFRFGGKRFRCTDMKCRPRPSELTQNEFHRVLLELEERLEEARQAFEGSGDKDALKGDLESIAEEVRAHGEEQRDKQAELPENFQTSGVGELLEERADYCENLASEIEQAAEEIEAVEADGVIVPLHAREGVFDHLTFDFGGA